MSKFTNAVEDQIITSCTLNWSRTTRNLVHERPSRKVKMSCRNGSHVQMIEVKVCSDEQSGATKISIREFRSAAVI